MDSSIFKKKIKEETTKDASNIFKKLYEGDEKLEKVKLLFLKKKYENTQMNNGDFVVEFLSRLMLLTNKMKSCGEKIIELDNIEKVIRALTTKFHHIIMEI